MKIALAVLMVFAGVMHFVVPGLYEQIVPRVLPMKRAIVYVSGVAEIALGAGILFPQTQVLAAWGLIALYVAVFPANINMAVNAERFRVVPEPLLWARLPLQALVIAWIWRVAISRPSA